MERIEFEDIYDLAEIMDSYVMSNVSEHEYPIISAYVDYKLAKSLVEILISMGNSIGAILELEDYEMSHYDKEYCVYLTEDGITCEKIFNDGGYYNGGGDISYVHEDCNSKLLSHIDSKTVYEFGIDEDDDCECDECECACKKDEKPAAASKESYFINGKSVDKSEFDKKYEEFEEMYLDNIRDMLLSYCEFMDEVNEWRSRMLRW
ncbi:MAG: hypothetical protein SO206_06945 [Bacilli bacterium]|nr:hypothetical protein [Bacilli bacterium]